MKKALSILSIFVLLISCKGDSSFSGASFSESGGGSGRGGSLARFTIIGDHLYTVNINKLKTFSLSKGSKLDLQSEATINAFAETIFPFRNHLLIGTRTGMFIYGLNNASNPNFVSSYSHFASCDPVVAQGNYAYVTLRNGTPCQRGQNQLDILNISNFNNPNLISSIPMSSPQGLSANGERLFITEGVNGLSLFDISDGASPEFSKKFQDINAFDVISVENYLIATGEKGISQYTISADNTLQLLSSINIGQ